MIKRLHLDISVAEKVLDIQLQAYRVEASLIGFDGIPQLEDTVTSLIDANETFYGYYLENVLIGFIACTLKKDLVTIHRLCVHPGSIQRGVASKLLNYIFSFDLNVVTQTAEKNHPAVNLYMKNGFSTVSKYQVTPGVYLIQLFRHANRTA